MAWAISRHVRCPSRKYESGQWEHWSNILEALCCIVNWDKVKPVGYNDIAIPRRIHKSYHDHGCGAVAIRVHDRDRHLAYADKSGGGTKYTPGLSVC